MSLKRSGEFEEDSVTKRQRSRVSMASWRAQLDIVEGSAAREQVIEAYESYLDQYANDGLTWSKYINFLLRDQTLQTIDKGKIEALFAKTLTKILNVELWKCYLHYIELINPITPDSNESTRQTVISAYQFAIDTIGMDPLHGDQIWSDFLKYLYHWQCITSQESAKRQELIEKSLLKLITIPSPNLEEHWKIFTGFENDIHTSNPAKARKIINEQSSQYMTLRSVNNELKKVISNPKLVELSERNSTKLINQLKIWNSWIQWENKNPLNLNDKDLPKRINLVYNLSCQFCRLLPEAWFNYANYVIIDQKNINLGKEILIDSLKINPKSLSLTIKLSSIYESNNEVEQINSLWKSFIEKLVSDEEEGQNEQNHIPDKSKKNNENGNDSITYCYIYWMKIMKRLTNTKQIRQVFALARKYSKIDYKIYVEYALIEHQNNDNKIAMKAFELGLRYFPNSVEMVLSYLDFLINIKDLTNFKKIIELSLDNFSNDDLIKLFIKYYQVESNFGNLNSINLLTKRYLKKFPQSTPFELLMVSSTDKSNFNPLLKLDLYRADSTVSEKTRISEDIDKLKVDEETDEEEHESKKEFIIPDGIYNLLRVLPNSEYYNDQPLIFDPEKTITFLKSMNISK